MKFLVILLLVIAICHAAPIEEQSAKAKRGLHLGLGYHAPLVSHSYVAAPAVYHHAPLYSHAPVYHAPLIAHAPVYTSHHVLPSYHSYHHFGK